MTPDPFDFPFPPEGHWQSVANVLVQTAEIPQPWRFPMQTMKRSILLLAVLLGALFVAFPACADPATLPARAPVKAPKAANVKSSAKPKTEAQQRVDRIAGALASKDAIRQVEAVAEVREWLANDPDKGYGYLRSRWLKQMLIGGMNGPAAELALAGVLASPQNTAAVTSFMELRTRALLADGKTAEALASAKSVFNVATMNRTAEAMGIVSECLRAKDPALAERFRDEQLAAGAAAGLPTPAAATTVLQPPDGGAVATPTATTALQPPDGGGVATLAATSAPQESADDGGDAAVRAARPQTPAGDEAKATTGDRAGDDTKATTGDRADDEAKATAGDQAGISVRKPVAGGSALAGIKVDPAIYAAPAAAGKPRAEDYRSLLAAENLLLLAHQPAAARPLFERAYSLANDHDLPAATENLARCMKAEDGNITRANAWLEALAAKE